LENPEAIRDQASWKANDINFKVRYLKLVETALKPIKQKTRSDKKPSAASEPCFVGSCSRLGQKGWAPCDGVSHSLYHDSGHA
jgi:hypothetical protein